MLESLADQGRHGGDHGLEEVEHVEIQLVVDVCVGVFTLVLFLHFFSYLNEQSVANILKGLDVI